MHDAGRRMLQKRDSHTSYSLCASDKDTVKQGGNRHLNDCMLYALHTRLIFEDEQQQQPNVQVTKAFGATRRFKRAFRTPGDNIVTIPATGGNRTRISKSSVISTVVQALVPRAETVRYQ